MSRLPLSLILLVVSLILSVILMRSGFTRETLYALAGNAVLLFAMRFVAKVEDETSAISIFIGLASLLLTGVMIEPMFAGLIVVLLNGGVLFWMRHAAKMEAFEAQTLIKPHSR